MSRLSMSNVEIIEAYSALRHEYEEYAAESRACGYEVATLEEWAGMESPKSNAQERIQAMLDADEWDLF